MANQGPTLDAKLFSRHILTFNKSWDTNQFDAFTFISGVAPPSGEHTNDTKTLALQAWLCGWEMTDTLIIVAQTGVFMLCTVQKAKLLEAMQPELDPQVKLTVFKLNKKDPEGTANQFQTLIKTLQSSHRGATLGSFLKEEKSGPFVSSWNAALAKASFEMADATDFASRLMCVKDATEQKCVRTAATITVSILKNYLVKKIEKIIDTEEETTHEEISKKVDEFFSSPEKISTKLKTDLVESCYAPIIQSKRYNLELMAPNTNAKLDFGTVICALGARYKQYCSDIARTYLIEPTKDQEFTYGLALSVQTAVIQGMKPGVTLSSLYLKAKNLVQTTKPDLLSKFLPSCGTAIGLEFSDDCYSINAGCDKQLMLGMTFNVRVGFHNVEDKVKGKYSILLGDTVLVLATGADVLTDKSTKKYVDVSYDIDSTKNDTEAAKPSGRAAPSRDAKPRKVLITEAEQPFSLRRNERLESVEVGTGRTVRKTIARELMTTTQSSESKRADHQEQLHQEMKKQAKKSFETKKKGGDEKKQEKDVREFIAYKSAKEFPLEAQPDMIHVDTVRESVILPIYGQCVPYHISTIKSVQKTEEFLRISFKYPGGPQTPAEKLKGELFAEPEATFIKEMTFRIPRVESLNQSFRLISELKKRVTSRESEIQQKMTLKVQPALQLSRVPGNIPRLGNLTIRPTLIARKTTGTLEAHINGFRFVSKKGGNVDIIYANVKHCFFQPADNSVIVVLHFHLHSDIMIGRKKTQDVQFYAEVMESSEAVSGPSRHQPRWGDAEEIEEEQQQKELLKRLNTDFKNFVKRVQDLEGANIEFDIPYKELGFYGVPNRNNLFLQPTVHCLINVIEVPFFIMCLDDVQIAYFERVQFSLKNFDLVFVFKDWAAKEVHINSIPVESLESIKDWLDNSNIKYYVGKDNLVWRTLLDKILKNPAKFWDDGGWDVLKEQEEHDESDDASGGDGPSDYSPSRSDSSDYDVGSESSSASAVSDGGSDEASDEDSEDSGVDWDELDERAAQHDQKKAQKRGRDDGFDSDDERGPTKRPRLAGPARGGKAPIAKPVSRGAPITRAPIAKPPVKPLPAGGRGRGAPLAARPSPGKPSPGGRGAPQRR